MRWEDERYVRVYTRDTVDWLAQSFDAKALWLMLLRKADRAGIIPLGKRGKRGVAVVVGHPERADALEAALGELLADGCCELSPDEGQLVIPNFIEAQEAVKSPTERQREYRQRARDAARAGLPPASKKGCVVYFIQSEHGGSVKVGRAEDLAKRLVGLQTGRPDKLVVLAAAPGTREDEVRLHKVLAAWRERGEWFLPSQAVMRAARLLAEHGAEAWALLDTVSGDEMSPETSPVSSPVATVASQVTSVTSPVTPSRAVPCCAVPSRAESPPSEEPGADAPAAPPPVQGTLVDEASTSKGPTTQAQDFAGWAQDGRVRLLGPTTARERGLKRHQWAALGELLRDHGRKLAEAAWLLWAADAYPLEQGLPLALFASQWPEWVTRAQRQSGAGPPPMPDVRRGSVRAEDAAKRMEPAGPVKLMGGRQ